MYLLSRSLWKLLKYPSVAGTSWSPPHAEDSSPHNLLTLTRILLSIKICDENIIGYLLLILRIFKLTSEFSCHYSISWSKLFVANVKTFLDQFHFIFQQHCRLGLLGSERPTQTGIQMQVLLTVYNFFALCLIGVVEVNLCSRNTWSTSHDRNLSLQNLVDNDQTKILLSMEM